MPLHGAPALMETLENTLCFKLDEKHKWKQAHFAATFKDESDHSLNPWSLEIG